MGQASRPAIRRAALAGAKPLHPLPLKGRKERNAEKEDRDHHSTDDPGNKKKIENQAAQANMTVTDYLTTCALGKRIVCMDGLEAVLTELKAQGRNLNQLTILANMGRLTVVRGDDLAESYAALCEHVHRLTQEAR